MLDSETLMKFAPASVATALASIVLPVPGGPKSSTPFAGCKSEVPGLKKRIQGEGLAVLKIILQGPHAFGISKSRG